MFSLDDPMFYIYTSGTTGNVDMTIAFVLLFYSIHCCVDLRRIFILLSFLFKGPSKAALFSHRRVIGAGLTWACPMNLTENDNYYIVLPLYHGYNIFTWQNSYIMLLSRC